jgi:hypothetical protein
MTVADAVLAVMFVGLTAYACSPARTSAPACGTCSPAGPGADGTSGT